MAHVYAPAAPRRHKPMELIRSYAADWIVSLALGGLFFWLGSIKGFRRRFSLDDRTIQFPYAEKERVPDFALALISTVAPFVLIPVLSAFSRGRSFLDIHCGWLGLIVSLTLAGSVTNIVKVTVGRPRPDLIDRCQPAAGAVDAMVFGLVSDAVCTQTSTKILNDGWRSFPSGHSSLTFAGLGFLSLYAAGKMHLWDKVGSAVKAWICLAPLMGAALVAITRTMDYRHHWQDVLAGSILGMVTAYFSYRQYFPSISDRHAGKPLPPLMDEERHSMLGMNSQNRGDEALADEETGEALRLRDTTPTVHGP